MPIEYAAREGKTDITRLRTSLNAYLVMADPATSGKLLAKRSFRPRRTSISAARGKQMDGTKHRTIVPRHDESYPPRALMFRHLDCGGALGPRECPAIRYRPEADN